MLGGSTRELWLGFRRIDFERRMPTSPSSEGAMGFQSRKKSEAQGRQPSERGRSKSAGSLLRVSTTFVELNWNLARGRQPFAVALHGPGSDVKSRDRSSRSNGDFRPDPLVPRGLSVPSQPRSLSSTPHPHPPTLPTPTISVTPTRNEGSPRLRGSLTSHIGPRYSPAYSQGQPS